MNLVEVLKKAGEQLKWQFLADAFCSMRRAGEKSEVTFSTTPDMAQTVTFQAFGVRKPRYIGVVLWIPAEAFEEEKSPAPVGPATEAAADSKGGAS